MYEQQKDQATTNERSCDDGWRANQFPPGTNWNSQLQINVQINVQCIMCNVQYVICNVQINVQLPVPTRHKLEAPIGEEKLDLLRLMSPFDQHPTASKFPG